MKVTITIIARILFGLLCGFAVSDNLDSGDYPNVIIYIVLFILDQLTHFLVVDL